MLASTTVVATSAPPNAVKILMMNLKFIPNTATVKAGKIVFFVTNSEPIGGTGHNIGLRSSAGQLIVVSTDVRPNVSVVFTIDHLARGTYKIVCTVGSHEEGGMVGTLKVT